MIVVRRTGSAETKMKPGRDYWFDDLLSVKRLRRRRALEPETRRRASYPLVRPLHIRRPAGSQRGSSIDRREYAVLLHATMKWVFDIKDTDVYWCPADIGLGDRATSYVAFPAPDRGARPTVIYEGTLDYPQPDRWWQVIERYGVSVFYTTPTATRMQMRFGEDFVRKRDRSSLRLIQSVGEPIESLRLARWLFEVVEREEVPCRLT